MVWVGLPTMRDDHRDNAADRLNRIYREVVTSTPGAAFVNAEELFSNPRGEYAAYLPDDMGREQLVRAPDGEHLSTIGYDWVADEVIAALQREWELPDDAVR